MTVRKLESGEWLADFRPNGRGSRRYRKKFKAKAEAVRYEAYVRAKVTKQPEWMPPQKDSRSLAALIETWFKNHGANLKDGKSRYKKLLKLSNLASDPLASEITDKWFVEFRKKRLEAGASPSTVNHDLAYLKALFNELERTGDWDKGNPLRNIRKLKDEPTELTYLQSDDIKLLLNYLKGLRDQDCYLTTKICLSTGARWSEAETLRVEHIAQNHVAFYSTKNGKPRYIPIDRELYQEIRQHARKRRGRLFKDSYGVISEVLKECGIALPKGQRTHVFRHTFASHFMMNGGNILVLQKILDHSSLQMTMRYAHFAPEHLVEATTKNPVVNLERKEPSVVS
ncbi:tyrosine-type recombinase/integrase [Marinobacter lacisalsi]|uniref:Tyrosine-type recombinase/integrase n=1 Tax=Marinobacter lacisalsi TaxID=475979 RepID=A0ABV8QMX3_9GAMM